MLKGLLNMVQGAGLKPAWLPSSPRPVPLDPVRLPRDEQPHERAVEWWHFMGRVYEPEQVDQATNRALCQQGLTFVVTTLKGRFKGITKLAGIVILIDHENELYS